SDEIHPFLSGECVPRWHYGTVQATGNGVVKIFVGGEGSRRGGSAFENRGGEVPWPWVDPLSGFTVAIAHHPVADHAITTVVHCAVRGTCGQVAHVGGGGR